MWARQDEIHLWQTVRAADGQGVYVDPLKFCLTAGRHEISLHYVDQPVTLGTLALVAPAAHPTYAEAAADYARVMELTETLGKLNDEQTELMMQWEELENRKAQLDGEK